jgi:F-type H+-transporting ATPase subunit b
MLIDWFTVGAQALNFVILVWLLRRFLYVSVRGWKPRGGFQAAAT